LTAVVLLPTPPLPEATAMMFLIPGTSFTPRCTAWGTIFICTLTLACPTPGRDLSFRMTSSRMGSSWLFAGYPSRISTDTWSPSTLMLRADLVAT
jgi:hypothetical protein